MMLAKKPADKNRATLDPALPSRIQFGFVIALLPAFTIGLASYIVMLEGLRLAARQPGRRFIYASRSAGPASLPWRSGKLTDSAYRRLSWGTSELLLLLERNRKGTNVFLLVDRGSSRSRGDENRQLRLGLFVVRGRAAEPSHCPVIEADV